MKKSGHARSQAEEDRKDKWFATLSITARDGGSRWYGRILIPREVIGLAGLRPGVRIAATRYDDDLVIEECPDGRARMPMPRGSSALRYVFEFSVTTLGLRPVALSQMPIPAEPLYGGVKLKVPRDLIAPIAKQKPRRSTADGLPMLMPWEIEARPRRRRSASDWSEDPNPIRAVMADARCGRGPIPARIGDIAEFLRKQGRRLERAGARLFLLDGVVVNWAAVVETANDLRASQGSPPFVLIADSP